jgi:hypothetical protein
VDGHPARGDLGHSCGVFNSIPYFGPVIVSGGLFVVGMVQSGGDYAGTSDVGGLDHHHIARGLAAHATAHGQSGTLSALAVFLGLLLWTWV